MDNPVLSDLINLLDIERIDSHIFRGQSRDLGGKSVFGGQVLSQALVAAARTVDSGATAHSLHAYFVRAGRMDAPIVYDVDIVRDGRSFAVRRVHAIQYGRPIFTMIASFHQTEPGLEHAETMPDVPPPESLRSQADWRKEWAADCPEGYRERFLRQLAIDFRPVEPQNPFHPTAEAPAQHIWFRADGALGDDHLLHQAVLTYSSDFSLLSTALLPHASSFVQRHMIVASLDHALWLHRPFRADEWMLYVMDSPTAQFGRGLSRGNIFARDGTLVASVAQESLMRDTRLLDAAD
ncbi:MAG: acyl-CoA thioesterase II [Oceanococcaceae bacterium]